MTTKEEWLQLVDQEEGESLALALVEDILQRSQHVLFEKHIDVQVLPYTVNFARDTLVSLVNYRFFRRDPGNIDPELWEQDEEPEPVHIDSWARGAVSTRTLSSHILRTEHSKHTSANPKKSDMVAKAVELVHKESGTSKIKLIDHAPSKTRQSEWKATLPLASVSLKPITTLHSPKSPARSIHSSTRTDIAFGTHETSSVITPLSHNAHAHHSNSNHVALNHQNTPALSIASKGSKDKHTLIKNQVQHQIKYDLDECVAITKRTVPEKLITQKTAVVLLDEKRLATGLNSLQAFGKSRHDGPASDAHDHERNRSTRFDDITSVQKNFIHTGQPGQSGQKPCTKLLGNPKPTKIECPKPPSNVKPKEMGGNVRRTSKIKNAMHCSSQDQSSVANPTIDKNEHSQDPLSRTKLLTNAKSISKTKLKQGATHKDSPLIQKMLIQPPHLPEIISNSQEQHKFNMSQGVLKNTCDLVEPTTTQSAYTPTDGVKLAPKRN
ncbi:hypothetical protein BDV3_004784 [Batrachochytrium dendrobatidis]|nr:hypothetical protein O5D80_007054 [Batrachochytrium dendrobatidis]KAK5671070.1 hypothetical protein QVD99_002830 [Batrachochytrium dendrobatidis]